MAAGTKLVEGMRRTKLTSQEISLFKQSFVLVPYQSSGYLDYTNKGYYNGQINPNDFETFKRVWSGNDAFVINWKKSCNLSQDPDTKEMNINFSLGEVILGLIVTNTNDVEIKQDESFSDYKSQQSKNVYTFRIEPYFEISDYYQFLFWKIPEVSGSTLFRVSSLEKEYVGTELVSYVMTLESLNQELANTGRARQQNVMPNSVGQGYLECIVEDKTWPERIGKEEFDKLISGRDYYPFFDRYITADFEKTKHNPAKKVVVKGLGVGTHSSFAAVGRPVLVGDALEKYRPQRLLFPLRLTEPMTPTLWRAQNINNNYYWCSLTPTLLYFKELMNEIKDSLTPVNQWSYQGFLLYNKAEAERTNPLEDGHFKYNLYGYLDTSVAPTVQVPWEIDIPVTSVSTSGTYGVENAYIIGGRKMLCDHMFDAFWTQKQYKALPIDKKSTLSFGPTLVSGLSSFATGLFQQNGWQLGLGTILSTIGIVGALTTRYTNKNIDKFYTFIDASLVDFNGGLFGNDIAAGDERKLPFNILDTNNNDNPSSIFFDGTTMQFGYEAKLTDLITSNRLPGKVLSTYNIGQEVYEDGTYILPSHNAFKLNGDAKLFDTYDTYSGYIIDSFKICGIFNGEYSIEFLDLNDEVIWSGVYQSEGKWTKSLREIWTEKNCSVFGRENVFYTDPIPYPKEVAPLEPDYTKGIESGIIMGVHVSGSLLYPGAGNTFVLGTWYGADFGGHQHFSRYQYPNNTWLFGDGRGYEESELLNNYSHIELKFLKRDINFGERQEIVNVPILDIMNNPNKSYSFRKKMWSISSSTFHYLVALVFPTPFFHNFIVEANYNIRIYYENKQLKINVKWDVFTQKSLSHNHEGNLSGYYILSQECNSSVSCSLESSTLKVK